LSFDETYGVTVCGSLRPGGSFNSSFFFHQSLPYAFWSTFHTSGKWSIGIHDAPKRSGAVFADLSQVPLDGDRTAGICSILTGERLSYFAYGR
jgi:hypothetical protein